MPAKKGAGKRPPPTPESLALRDRLQAEATDAAALAIGDRLQTLGIQRPVHTLTRHELNLLAGDCISRWVATRASQFYQHKDAAIGKEILAG